MAEDLVLATLLAHLELDLAAQRRQARRQVADPRDGLVLAGAARRGAARAPAMPSAAATANRAETPERWSTADELAQLVGEPRDDLEQVVRHLGDQVAPPGRSSATSSATSSG